jgi:hypothetical protein
MENEHVVALLNELNFLVALVRQNVGRCHRHALI